MQALVVENCKVMTQAANSSLDPLLGWKEVGDGTHGERRQPQNNYRGVQEDGHNFTMGKGHMGSMVRSCTDKENPSSIQ